MYVVGDWMTKAVVTLRESDDLANAAALFRLGRIRHLPVVRGEKLVGLLTQRDLLRALGTRQPEEANLSPVKELMRTKLLTARTTTPLRSAARSLLKNKVGCLPVVGPGKRLLGIVTESDLVRLAAQLLDDLDKMDEVALQVAEAKRRR